VGAVPIDWDHVRASLDRGANRIGALLRTAPDGNATVKGLEWTVSDLGAHLVTEAQRFARFGEGRSQPLGDVAAINDDELRAVGERDPAVQAGLFLDAHAGFMQLAKSHGGNDPFMWFDVPMEWADAGCVYLGELNVHAIDLARTFGGDTRIAKEDAVNIAYGLLPVLPRFVDQEKARGFNGTFKLALRGAIPLLLEFYEGALSIVPARRGADDKRADCTITADPEAFLLVGYGRSSQWRPILRGKLRASGRKPWLGLKFASLLLNP
jgi:uncharacterized protein (TIGR03083 family)